MGLCPIRTRIIVFREDSHFSSKVALRKLLEWHQEIQGGVKGESKHGCARYGYPKWGLGPYVAN